jgi:transposase-like protein
MAKRTLTEDFKKQCVEMRLKGVDYQKVCEHFKIHPPQLNKWMKEFGDQPQFADLKKQYAITNERKQHATAMVQAKPTNALYAFPMGITDKEVRKAHMQEVHKLLRKWGMLQLHYDLEDNAVKVYDEFTKFPPGCKVVELASMAF